MTSTHYGLGKTYPETTGGEIEFIPASRITKAAEYAVAGAKDAFGIPDDILAPSSVSPPPVVSPLSVPLPTSLTAVSSREAYRQAILTILPHRADEMLPPPVPVAYVPLKERSTDDLLDLVDRGLSLAEIARFWKHGRSRISEWIASDGVRSARVSLARKQQADMWADIAGELLFLCRGGDMATQSWLRSVQTHIEWRCAVLDPERFGKKVKMEHTEQRSARELSTAELEIIAHGGVLPGGF